MVQEHVLETIDSRELKVYAVWEPILRTDDERSSRKATMFFPDDRVKNYWTSTQDVGKAFQHPLDLTTEPAWDVYLLYAPQAKWVTGQPPPRPDFYMHQLGGRLPDGATLDGPGLASEVRRVLSR